MEATEVPIGNIGARGCQRRRTGGWVWSVIAAIAAGWMLSAHVSRALLLLLSVPIFFAALGFLQAREETCVFHAINGTRENDDGVVKLDERAQPEVARRARRVWALSTAVTAGVLAIVFYVVLRMAR